MSDTVTVTRTVNNRRGRVKSMKDCYCRSGPGILKIVEMILNATIYFLLFYLRNNGQVCGYSTMMYLEYMAVALFIGTFCLLLSSTLSPSGAVLISKTIYEIVYHMVATILLLSASILFYFTIDHYELFSYRNYYYLAAILGFANSFWYLVSTIVAIREYRL